jgi:putative ABC transport system permease protein
MQTLPLKYNIRNVIVRWRATLATVLGIALVVAVYVLVQALARGLESSSQNTGHPLNVMIVRQGSTAESSSQVTPEQFRVVHYLPGIAAGTARQRLISADVVVLINLARKGLPGEANVLLRGVSPNAFNLRPQVRLIDGRWFKPGLREVVVSRKLSNRFANFEVGKVIRCGGRELHVVGMFDAGNSAFDSEIWMDADEVRRLFDRENYSSVLVRAESEAALKNMENRISAEKRLPLRAIRETDYYAAQTMTAMPIKILGNFLATMMSIGAIFSAMNTMYASVGARTREVGTLRVLGYGKFTILLSFLLEGMFLSLIGGALGTLLAFPMHGYSTGTISFESFSETVFEFRITAGLVAQGLIFALVVGMIGSLLPAWKASRTPVISALKSV